MGKIENIQDVDIGKLVPYINNAKKHNDDQITKIASSIREFGFLSPCLIDKDYNIIAGHGRVEAAKKLGMDKVPCVFVEGLTEAQKKAYILADNRLAELSGWDYELVDLELDELKGLGFDVELTGFDGTEMDPHDFDGLFTDAPEKEKEPKQVQCPHCGEWFEV